MILIDDFFLKQTQANKKYINYKKYFFISLNLINLINLSSYAADFINLPKNSAVQGGVINIEFKSRQSCTGSKLPKAYFNNKQVLVLPKFENINNINNCQKNKLYNYIAIVGLPLDTKPGDYYLTYHESGESGKQDNKTKFKVLRKSYRTSKITVADNNMVTPDTETENKIMADQHKIAQAVNIRTDDIPSKLFFKQPVSGYRTTSFGSKRIINNIIKNPHTGMDIAAKINTKVVAVADGEVVLAEPFYLPGNMVAINHGSGLITLYGHLSYITVKVGDRVKTGDIIGRVGQTGRVTGPHLHWAVKLNQASVDPELFLNHV